jgi:hypothetical protein
VKARPALIAHADWGKSPAKRWIATALLAADRYEALSVRPIADTRQLLRSLVRQADGGSVLLGVDFPMGLPLAYAQSAGIGSFRRFLTQIGHGRWTQFCAVARERHEISRERPFYPHAPGGKRIAHLLEALELESVDLLHRHCERATASRGAASPLFWTLGAKQAGRAAIAGWLELLRPGIREFGRALALWPFDGPLEELIRDRSIVICETYPANAYTRLGLPRSGRGWSKRKGMDRRGFARQIQDWARRQRIALRTAIAHGIREGFGDRADGEDAFDATIGLLGMIELIQSGREVRPKLSRRILDVEGWMLGFEPGERGARRY